MLTMTVAIPVASKQSNGPASSDRADTQSRSFAKSFDESVALATIADANPAVPPGAAESLDAGKGNALNMGDVPVVPAPKNGAKMANGATVAKNLNEAADASDRLRAGATFGKVFVDAGEIVRSVVISNTVVAKAASSEPKTKMIGDDTNAVQADAPASKGGPTADKVSEGQGTVLSGSAEVRIALPPSQVAEAGVPSMSSDSALVKTDPVADVKVEKSQESKGLSKGKVSGKNKNVTNEVTNRWKELEHQVIPSAVVAAVSVPAPVQQSGPGSGASSPGDVALPTGGQTTGATVAAGKSGKAGTGSQKIAPSDSKPAVQASTDGVSTSNAASEVAKTGVLAVSVGSDSDAKTRGATPATAHSLGIAGLVGGIAPAHGVGLTSGIKLQSADVSTQIAAGHTAHDAPGTMTPADDAHRTLTATPTMLEVGIANGTHGWLKIRAEMTGPGVVNASLSAASPAAQEMLHRELPSLTSYLQQEQVAVNTVVVHPMVASPELRSLVGGMGSNGGGQAQQGSHQGGASAQASIGSSTDEVASGGVGAVGVDGLLSPVYAAGGRWLSVRA